MSFYVKFTDGTGKEITLEVSLEIYEVFEEERKEKERYRKERKNHLTDEPFDEEKTISRLHTPSVLDTVIQQSKLRIAQEAIKTCTEVQQRRFYLNRILGYSFTEIAKIENCSKQSVQESVAKVIKKLDEVKKSF